MIPSIFGARAEENVRFNGKATASTTSVVSRRALGEIGNGQAAIGSRPVARQGVHEAPPVPTDLNVDGGDADEPAAVSEYVNDIYAFFKNQEVREACSLTRARERGGRAPLARLPLYLPIPTHSKPILTLSPRYFPLSHHPLPLFPHSRLSAAPATRT